MACAAAQPGARASGGPAGRAHLPPAWQLASTREPRRLPHTLAALPGTLPHCSPHPLLAHRRMGSSEVLGLRVRWVVRRTCARTQRKLAHARAVAGRDRKSAPHR